MRIVKIVSVAAAFAFGTALPTTAPPTNALPATAPPTGGLPSNASPLPGPVSSLTLTLSVAGGPARSVRLACDGQAGGHPDPTTACGLVGKVGGDLSKLTYDIDMICPDEYVPHTVQASGTWEGRPVWFGRTYDNRCEMTALTGPLFHI
ncbi:SSI family serine proteinase inhibitor [Streptosporangium sp. CA-135522]|uniref:SSI family serine proteinase inhibitor n=1 Tax=Streptosporangium sp. CA-135522 TaxID=3240072 RepID=UPI003D92D7B8